MARPPTRALGSARVPHYDGRMFSWPWKKKAEAEPEPFVDRVWMDLAARDRAVVRAAQAGPVLVVAFFDETLARVRQALHDAGCPEGPTLVVERADQVSRVPPGAAVLLAERHPLPAHTRALVARLGALSPGVAPVCFTALDDALMREFGLHDTAELMRKLGMQDDEPIEHGLVTKALANASRKLEQRIGPAVSRLAPAASMGEWLKLNLPPKG